MATSYGKLTIGKTGGLKKSWVWIWVQSRKVIVNSALDWCNKVIVCVTENSEYRK